MTLHYFLFKECFLGNSALIPITESALAHAFRCIALSELIGSLFLVQGFLAGRLDRVAWVKLEVRLHNQLDRTYLQFAWRWRCFKSVLHLIWSVDSSLVYRVVLSVNLRTFALSKSWWPAEILIVGLRLRRSLVRNDSALEVSMVNRLLFDV